MSFQSIIKMIIAFFESIWLFFAGLFSPPAKPVDPVIIPPPDNPQVLKLDDFSLVWSDDFDGDTLDDYSKTDWEWSMFDPAAKLKRHETVLP